MILIIGGAYQGKTAYAKQTYGLQDADIFTCEGLALDPAARCVRHLERFALACVQAGKEPADELRTLDLSDKILLCEDISCGVVPIDPEQRAWREAVGRMNAMLAARELEEKYPGRRLEVVDMPLTVLLDAHGGDLYQSGPQAYLQSLT